MNDASAKPTVTIKKYANRRLYNTATSSYVTLENLSVMVKEGTEFNVYDAKTGEDLTRSVLTQIIVEEEGKSGQQNLLPISFLRQLIGFYGDNMQWMVPKYLEQSMDALSKNQDQMRGYLQSTFGHMFPFGTTLEEMGKQNLSMFERTMRLFAPFAAIDGATDNGATTATGADSDAAATADGAPAPTTDTATTTKAATPMTATEEARATAAAAAVSALASVTNINRRLESVAPAVSAAIMSEEAAAPAYASGGGAATPVYASTTSASSAASSYGSSSATSAPMSMPMANVQNTMSSAPSADDMQQKIANLQRQLAELAKNRG